MNTTAKYWKKIEEGPRAGQIECLLCPRGCKLKEEKRGVCFVRRVVDGELKLTTYGRSSGFCIDPIEKKPLSHFYPNTPVLSFGTVGCNLTCMYCQNWDISSNMQDDMMASTAPPSAIAKAAKHMSCKSVAFTYNDPIVFLEYACDTAAACQEIGLKTVAVTNGYINSEPRKEMFKNMDAVNVDLKGFSDRFYQKLCKATLQPVLDTLLYIKNETDCWLEITNLVIPKENDSEKEIEAMTKWIRDNLGKEVPVHFTAFHPDYRMVQSHPPTPLETLKTAQTIARGNDLLYVYTGNVRDEGGSTTYCPQCGDVVIGRDGYELTEYHLSEQGKCRGCGHVIAGHFDESPGTWGNRRAPIDITEYG
jgi:pyruvate formate lyase activating enzyme